MTTTAVADNVDNNNDDNVDNDDNDDNDDDDDDNDNDDDCYNAVMQKKKSEPSASKNQIYDFFVFQISR